MDAHDTDTATPNEFEIVTTRGWTSRDETIVLPVEVHLYPDGSAVACYDGAADEPYASLDALLDAHGVDPGMENDHAIR